MKVAFTHKLEFDSREVPKIGELQAILRIALEQGFPEDTPVHIRAGEDQREHNYYFAAIIGARPLPAGEPFVPVHEDGSLA